MNKQELINKLTELKFSHVSGVQGLSIQSQCYNEAIKAAILLAKQLDEPEKVTEQSYVAVRSNNTGRVEYCTEDWLFCGSERNAMPCKEIRYVDMLHCGMESYYEVTFKANQYTYTEELPVYAFTGIKMIEKEES